MDGVVFLVSPFYVRGKNKLLSFFCPPRASANEGFGQIQYNLWHVDDRIQLNDTAHREYYFFIPPHTVSTPFTSSVKNPKLSPLRDTLHLLSFESLSLLLHVCSHMFKMSSLVNTNGCQFNTFRKINNYKISIIILMSIHIMSFLTSQVETNPGCRRKATLLSLISIKFLYLNLILIDMSTKDQLQ